MKELKFHTWNLCLCVLDTGCNAQGEYAEMRSGSMDTNNMNAAVQQEQQAVQVKKKPVKGVVLALLTLLAFLAIQVTVSGVGAGVYMVKCMAQTGGDIEMSQELYMQQISESGFMTDLLMITTIICAAVALLWYRFGIVKKYTQQQKQDFKELINGRNIAVVVVTAIGCYGIALLLSQIIGALVPGSMETYQELMGFSLSGSALIAALTVVIIAPIGEELIFRGIIFRLLEKNLPVVAAIIIQAVLFGIYHMNIMQGLYVLPLALALGYTAYRTKSVYPCILMHMVNNFMPSLLAVLPESVPTVPVAIIIIVISAAVLYPLTKGMRAGKVSA